MEKTARYITNMFSLRGLYGIKKELFARLGIDKVCKYIDEKTTITPNQITLVNIALGFLAIWLLFSNQLLVSLLLIANFVIDNFDGYYARIRGKETRLGQLLDHAGDFAIGWLFLIKSYWYFGDWWTLLATVSFAVEMAVIWKIGLFKDKFPVRLYIIFFIFGFYWEGLLAQAIYQPLSFLAFLIMRKKGLFVLEPKR